MSGRSKSSWEQGYRLGGACTIKHGFAFKGEFMTTEENDALPIVVNIVNFQYTGGFRFESTKVQRYSGSFPSEYELRPGEVLVVMTCQTPKGEILGVPGRIPQGTNRFLHNQRMGLAVLKNSDVLDLGYLYYLFLSSDFNQHLFATSTGAKILHTAPSRIEDYRFARPPIDVQRRIAGILSAYDDLIENNTRRIKILEDMAQMIYREWFVNFRFPGHEKVRMVESELGPIPKSWTVRSLRDVTSYISRGISPAYDDSAAGWVINQKCIRDRRLNLGPARKQSKPVSPEKVLRKGDILINSTGVGTLGRVAQVHQELVNFTADSHVSIVRPTRNADYLGELALQLESSFEAMGVGSTGQTELGRERIAGTLFVCPPDPLQTRYAEHAQRIHQLSLCLLQKNENLRTTRDFLLPKLISGEISVEAAAELMEQTA